MVKVKFKDVHMALNFGYTLQLLFVLFTTHYRLATQI